jgi:hypothetical protein
VFVGEGAVREYAAETRRHHGHFGDELVTLECPSDRCIRYCMAAHILAYSTVQR